MDELALYLYSASLNIRELDNKPCALCGEIPSIKVVTDETHSGKPYIDRTSRMDCDGGGKKQSLPMTYHKKCYLKACRNYVSA
jgi:hypothetical protein